jgi:hypothetical protein
MLSTLPNPVETMTLCQEPRAEAAAIHCVAMAFQEFAAKNRMEGTAGFVTVAFPIGTPPKQVE